MAENSTTPSERASVRVLHLVVHAFRVKADNIQVLDAIVATLVILGLVSVRFVVGPAAFTAGAGAFFAFLLSRTARHLWKVLLFVGLYGGLVTAIAQNVEGNDTAAIAFIWAVTFAAGLAIVVPLANAMSALINIWAIVAMNVTADTGTPVRSVLFWFAGASIAILAVWILNVCGPARRRETIDFTLQSIPIDGSVRRSVLRFAAIRATAVGAAGLLGLIVFESHPWWGAMSALVVAGINPEESKRIAAARALGTVIGVVAGMAIASGLESTAARVAVLLGVCFLGMALREANQLLFAALLTVILILIAGLRTDSLILFAGGRLSETIAGVALGLLAVRLTQADLEIIGTYQRVVTSN